MWCFGGKQTDGVTCRSCRSDVVPLHGAALNWWMNHSSCSNSGLRLLPSGLNQRGLFDFIFFLAWFSAWLSSWLYGRVNSSFASQAVPALPSSVVEVPPRDSPVKSDGNQTNKLWQEATCYLLGTRPTLSWVSLWNASQTLTLLPCCRHGSGVSCQRLYPGNESSVVEDSQTGLQTKDLQTTDHRPDQCLSAAVCPVCLDRRQINACSRWCSAQPDKR